MGRGAPLLALSAALVLGAAVAAEARTGQSPDCRRFCMSVEPREGPEGSVFRFTGRRWRPNRRVTATFGAYCRPDEACIAIAYVVRLRTGDDGRFSFRLRAGPEQPGDEAHGIRSGNSPTFSQRVGRPGRIRYVSRIPSYRVTLPG